MLTISVKNFGPIAEGSVDLKPLTIFVGPSNTGKSYMATAVYAVTKAAPMSENWVRLSSDKSYEMSEGLLTVLSDWAKQDFGSFRTSTITVSNLPEKVRAWVNDATSGHLENYRNDVAEEIQKLHGGTSFVRLGQNIEDYRLAVSQDRRAFNLEIQLTDLVKGSLEFDISQSELPEYMLGNFPWALLNTKNDRIRAQTVGGWVHSIAAVIFDGFPGQVYYLPAGRSAITLARKAVSAELILQHRFAGTRRETVSPLPRAMTVFLSDLVSLERRNLSGKDYNRFQKVASFIESDVLGGKIDIDESSGLPLPEFVYLPSSTDSTGDKFTLEHTSSMVSELAPLVLFLKYLVRPGDLLIIEEPESHLHPAAQRQLARGIVRLVNAGVQVLITTHSDIMISQINNLLALRQASPELVEQGGFEPEDFLEPEQVGAYLFRYNRELGGCETGPLEIDPDTGIDEDEFANVFEAIYNESIALQRDRN